MQIVMDLVLLDSIVPMELPVLSLSHVLQVHAVDYVLRVSCVQLALSVPLRLVVVLTLCFVQLDRARLRIPEQGGMLSMELVKSLVLVDISVLWDLLESVSLVNSNPILGRPTARCVLLVVKLLFMRLSTVPLVLLGTLPLFLVPNLVYLVLLVPTLPLLLLVPHALRTLTLSL